jgi:hypothetical protein
MIKYIKIIFFKINISNQNDLKYIKKLIFNKKIKLFKNTN